MNLRLEYWQDRSEYTWILSGDKIKHTEAKREGFRNVKVFEGDVLIAELFDIKLYSVHYNWEEDKSEDPNVFKRIFNYLNK